jgi:GrpB-like predicted nucleotidyltransferase (UPF0157 family)
MVTFVDPDPRWPHEYERIAAVLARAAGEAIERIDHIGSTAVPGLAAKDILDVQLTVASRGDLDAAVEALARAGWRRLPHDISRDHPVPGFPDDPAAWEKGYLDEPPGERPVHVHVRVAGRPNQRYPLLVRDYLRAHPNSAAAYAALKQGLARIAADSATYADSKDPACDLIYFAAEAWASSTGWTPTSASRFT